MMCTLKEVLRFLKVKADESYSNKPASKGKGVVHYLSERDFHHMDCMYII
jgi:hypothetical protein